MSARAASFLVQRQKDNTMLEIFYFYEGISS